MAIEGMQEASYKEQKKRGLTAENFHLDPDKQIDPVEDLLLQRGPDEAVAYLEARLDKNPNDDEARRQLNLIRNRLADLVTQISSRIDH